MTSIRTFYTLAYSLQNSLDYSSRLVLFKTVQLRALLSLSILLAEAFIRTKFLGKSVAFPQILVTIVSQSLHSTSEGLFLIVVFSRLTKSITFSMIVS